MTDRVQVTAPGSIMVTGEHAVVYGHPAIVCAIDQRICIVATSLTIPVVEVHSTISEPVSLPLDSIKIEGPYKFVLAVVARYADKLSNGVRLDITSQIDPTMGLGSSAAVTAASLAAVHCLAHNGQHADIEQLHQTGLAITREIQGRGSGADLAASLHGGMVAYQIDASRTDASVAIGDIIGRSVSGDSAAGKATPGNSATGKAMIKALPAPPGFSLRYSGYKTSTADVLARVAAAQTGNEQRYNELYGRMGQCAHDAIAAADSEEWVGFASHLQAYQMLMQELGVSDDTLDRLISEARLNPATLAVKISGSGLGDCVVALGPIPAGFTPMPIAREGVCINA